MLCLSWDGMCFSYMLFYILIKKGLQREPYIPDGTITKKSFQKY